MSKPGIGTVGLLALTMVLSSGVFPMQSHSLQAQPSYCDLWPEGEGCGAQVPPPPPPSVEPPGDPNECVVYDDYIDCV